MGRIAAVLAYAVSLAAGCGENAASGLEGRWQGYIACGQGRSTVTMSLEVLGSTIDGTSATRTREVDSTWRVRGSQAEKERSGPCADDTCASDADCRPKGGGKCNEHGLCQPCSQPARYREVTLTYLDDDVQSIDPVLTLERHGDVRMTGSVKSFCPDELFATPHVVLDKK